MAAPFFFLKRNCSGNGEYFEVPDGSTVGFTSYCACYPGFSGQSDYFDLRVAMPNVTGELALDCPLADIWLKAAWGVVLATYVIRLIITFFAFGKKWRDYKQLQKSTHARKNMTVFTYMPFRALALDTVG